MSIPDPYPPPPACSASRMDRCASERRACRALPAVPARISRCRLVELLAHTLESESLCPLGKVEMPCRRVFLHAVQAETDQHSAQTESDLHQVALLMAPLHAQIPDFRKPNVPNVAVLVEGLLLVPLDCVKNELREILILLQVPLDCVKKLLDLQIH